MRSWRVLLALVVVALGVALIGNVGVGPAFIAVLAGGIIFKMGFSVLRVMAQPVPEPPPAGELRKVKIEFRCSICGTEVRMTTANDEMPDPPKHCLEEMDLVAPVV